MMRSRRRLGAARAQPRAAALTRRLLLQRLLQRLLQSLRAVRRGREAATDRARIVRVSRRIVRVPCIVLVSALYRARIVRVSYAYLARQYLVVSACLGCVHQTWLSFVSALYQQCIVVSCISIVSEAYHERITRRIRKRYMYRISSAYRVRVECVSSAYRVRYAIRARYSSDTRIDRYRSHF